MADTIHTFAIRAALLVDAEEPCDARTHDILYALLHYAEEGVRKDYDEYTDGTTRAIVMMYDEYMKLSNDMDKIYE